MFQKSISYLHIRICVITQFFKKGIIALRCHESEFNFYCKGNDRFIINNLRYNVIPVEEFILTWHKLSFIILLAGVHGYRYSPGCNCDRSVYFGRINTYYLSCHKHNWQVIRVSVLYLNKLFSLDHINTVFNIITLCRYCIIVLS